MGPTWGPSGADRTQLGPMLAPWTFFIWECIDHYFESKFPQHDIYSCRLNHKYSCDIEVHDNVTINIIWLSSCIKWLISCVADIDAIPLPWTSFWINFKDILVHIYEFIYVCYITIMWHNTVKKFKGQYRFYFIADSTLYNGEWDN